MFIIKLILDTKRLYSLFLQVNTEASQCGACYFASSFPKLGSFLCGFALCGIALHRFGHVVPLFFTSRFHGPGSFKRINGVNGTDGVDHGSQRFRSVGRVEWNHWWSLNGFGHHLDITTIIESRTSWSRFSQSFDSFVIHVFGILDTFQIREKY